MKSDQKIHRKSVRKSNHDQPQAHDRRRHRRRRRRERRPYELRAQVPRRRRPARGQVVGDQADRLAPLRQHADAQLVVHGRGVGRAPPDAAHDAGGRQARAARPRHPRRAAGRRELAWLQVDARRAGVARAGGGGGGGEERSSRTAGAAARPSPRRRQRRARRRRRRRGATRCARAPARRRPPRPPARRPPPAASLEAAGADGIRRRQPRCSATRRPRHLLAKARASAISAAATGRTNPLWDGRGARGFLVVFDLTDRASFREAEAAVQAIVERFEYDASSRRRCPLAIVLAGNKADLTPGNERTISLDEVVGVLAAHCQSGDVTSQLRRALDTKSLLRAVSRCLLNVESANESRAAGLDFNEVQSVSAEAAKSMQRLRAELDPLHVAASHCSDRDALLGAVTAMAESGRCPACCTMASSLRRRGGEADGVQCARQVRQIVPHEHTSILERRLAVRNCRPPPSSPPPTASRRRRARRARAPPAPPPATSSRDALVRQRSSAARATRRVGVVRRRRRRDRRRGRRRRRRRGRGGRRVRRARRVGAPTR